MVAKEGDRRRFNGKKGEKALDQFRRYAMPLRSGCVVWEGPMQAGCPLLCFEGKRVQVNRWLYESENGPGSIPEGANMRRTCGTPNCVRHWVVSYRGNGFDTHQLTHPPKTERRLERNKPRPWRSARYYAAACLVCGGTLAKDWDIEIEWIACLSCGREVVTWEVDRTKPRKPQERKPL